MNREIPRTTPGIDYTDSMQSAGLKVLRLHYAKMRSQQADVQAGSDIEAVHDMRVAMRRMRVALRVFKPYFHQGRLKGYGKRVKAVGRVLGPLRDIDVFLEKTRFYLEQHSQDEQALSNMEGFFGTAREELQVKAWHYFASQAYADVLQDFEGLRETEPINSGPTVQACASGLIAERLSNVRGFKQDWQQADYVTLHRLRIAFKRLRYSIEFFEDLLGPEQHAAIELLKAVQDHLGDLNDAQVALQLVADLPDEHKDAHTQDYFDHRMRERDGLIASFPNIWHRFANGQFESNVEAALRPLQNG